MDNPCLLMESIHPHTVPSAHSALGSGPVVRSAGHDHAQDQPCGDPWPHDLLVHAPKKHAALLDLLDYEYFFLLEWGLILCFMSW